MWLFQRANNRLILQKKSSFSFIHMKKYCANYPELLFYLHTLEIRRKEYTYNYQ